MALQTRLYMKLSGFLVYYPRLDENSNKTSDEALGISCTTISSGHLSNEGLDEASEKAFSSYFGYLAHYTFKHTNETQLFCTHESSQFEL
jgi:hypothetical protein